MSLPKDILAMFVLVQIETIERDGLAAQCHSIQLSQLGSTHTSE